MYKFLFMFVFSFSVFAKVEEFGHSSVKTSTHKPWFTIQKDVESDFVEVSIKDENKSLISLEKINTSLSPFTTYEWQQFQTNEQVTIKRDGKKLHFHYKSSPGSAGTSKTIDVSDYEFKRLTLPPMLTSTLLSKVAQSPHIQEFDLLVIVPDKMLLLKFNFFRIKAGEEIEWELKPDSFFVGLIVDPVKFIFDKNMKLIRIKNIMMPVKFKDDTGDLTSKKTDLEFPTN